MASKGLVLALCILLLPTDLTAVPLDEFYPFGVDVGDSLVPRNDDGSSDPIALPTAFNFFGQLFSSINASYQPQL